MPDHRENLARLQVQAPDRGDLRIGKVENLLCRIARQPEGCARFASGRGAVEDVLACRARRHPRHAVAQVHREDLMLPRLGDVQPVTATATSHGEFSPCCVPVLPASGSKTCLPVPSTVVTVFLSRSARRTR